MPRCGFRFFRQSLQNGSLEFPDATLVSQGNSFSQESKYFLLPSYDFFGLLACPRASPPSESLSLFFCAHFDDSLCTCFSLEKNKRNIKINVKIAYHMTYNKCKRGKSNDSKVHAACDAIRITTCYVRYLFVLARNVIHLRTKCWRRSRCGMGRTNDCTTMR